MVRFRPAALLALLALGCATPSWTHPTKTESEFYKDKADCSAKAGQAARGAGGAVWTETYEACMYGEGWRKTGS